MANITLMGASYEDVPAVTLPQTGGGTVTFTDVTDTTATAEDVATGKYFYTADGAKTAGASSGGGGGGGSSSWTKVAETSYQVSTTSTSAATVATWATGHSEIWTTNKILYIRIRDTAGKRAGYFYGSDSFLLGGFVGTANTNGIRFCIRYTNDGKYGVSSASSATGYGFYADTVYSDGRLRLRARYNENNSFTINSTYKIEVYLLDPAGGVPIFK